MSNDYGDGVSRVLDPTATQYLSLIWQEGAPPCDAEYTLMQDLAAGRLSQSTLAGSPSGWLGNEVNFSKDFVTDPSWSNWFKFGLQAASDHQSVMWANVNGWLIPVTGTRTGLPPGSADNSDTWNKILLDPPPGSAGDARADFVFLEVWKARISPNPSTLNKPNAAAIYRYGNVEGGFSYLPDDLIDPEIGEPTTERIQLQYRIRVVKGLVNLSANPDGFDPTVVKAQGSQANPPSVGGYTFTNMKSLLGDPGLWRAGDGTENNLGTVDGYVYAVPICVIFRRNSSDWAGNPSPNLNGSFNRNTAAVDRNGAATFAPITLNTVMTAGTTYSSINLTTTSVMPSTGTIKIGDEILTYNGVSGSTLNLITRAQFGTVATDSHSIGDTVELLSGRPDGLFADQVTNTDILDLRHAVNPSGFDHQSLLLSNLDKLFKGQLRSNWKRSGTDPRGSFVFYEDLISASPPAIAGVTALDAPDHFRLAFSDAAIQQPLEVLCHPLVSGPIFPVVTQTALPAVGWDMEVATNTLKQQVASSWTSETTDGDGTGDQIQIPITQFQVQSLPGVDADQVRFLNEVPVSSSTGTSTGSTQFVDASIDFSKVVSPGDTIVIFVGVSKGSYVVSSVTASVLSIDPTTSSSSTIPAAYPVTYIIRRGAGSVQLRLEGTSTNLPQHRFDVTPYNPGPTDPLVIRFIGAGAPFPTPSVDLGSSRFYITTHLQYGGGRGLSRRPDTIHNIVLYNPTDGYLTKLVNYPSHDYPLSTAWAALWSKFRNAPYKGLLPVTADAYADLGSKTVILTPFQKISFPSNTHFLTAGSTIMPASEGSPGTSDPLSLFNHTTYVTLPRHLIPGWGAVHVPIRAIDDTNFDQGINFMLTSKKGSPATSDLNQNPTYINYLASSVSCAIFSTNNLSNLSVVIPYNTALSFNGYNYAGIRLFNDDPTALGALTTARGMGRQGIELPPYYGIARLFGVYEADDYATRGSAFNVTSHGDRSARSGGATNLLRQDFEGPSFWIELDDQGASTFVLSAEAIDITKSTTNPITSFATGKYVIEANVFGFGKGSFDLTQQFQLALSSAATPAPGVLTVQPPNTIIPAPVRINDSILINYSRTPYQGDPWGSQTAFSDVQYLEGPLSSATAFELASTDLTGTLTRPNQKPLEILASVGFITSLGTGRLSGDFVQPNVYDFRNVGYEDPTGPNLYPPPRKSSPRPITKTGAIGSSPIFGDLEASPEYLGCTTRLPLGALYRDKDFKGGRFSDDFASPLVYSSNTGVGSGVAGLGGSTTLDQSEVLATPASVSSGVPGDVLIHVDGEQSNYNLLTNFRTARGGSIFVGSGDHPGGELFATYERVQGSVNGTRTLVGRAFLVRNAPTTVSGNQVSAGDELMLAVATQVMEVGTTPSEALILLGTNGSGEGYSAADLYRIEGHPLLANHTFYNVDPTTIELPVGRTISQITDPPAIAPFPMGAPNTVYASNGSYNFWSNAPTLTALFLTNDLHIGGNIIFNATDPFPQIYQADAAPGVAGTALQIVNQRVTPTASTTSGFSAAPTILATADVSTPTAGWRANSGNVQVQSGTIQANVIGNAGAINVSAGSNLGTGNSGAVHIGAGVAFNAGNGGEVTVTGGNAFGPSGNAGRVIISGGTAINGSNPSGTAGDVIIQGGHCGSIAGNGGNIHLNAGSGPTDGYVDVLLGLGVVRYAQFTNVDLIIGPQNGGSSNYGLQFSAITTNPTINQATAITGSGAALTIKSQNGATGTNYGGNLNLYSGDGTSGSGAVRLYSGSSAGSVGDVSLGNANITNVRLSLNDTEDPAFGPYLVELGDGFNFHDFNLVFSSRVTGAKIGQKSTNVTQDLTIKAASISSIWTGNGGNLILEAGDGLGSAFNGGDIILFPGNPGAGGTIGRVTGGADTGSGNGRDLTIVAQSTTAVGFEGGDLNLNGGTGDFTGGTVSLNGGTASGGTGGDIIINSGPGSSAKGLVRMRVAGFDCLTLGESGPRVVQGSGPFGLHFDSTNPEPTVIGDGVLFVSLSKSLKFIGLGTSKVIEGTVARIVDTGAFTASPVTSSSPVNLLGVPGPTFTGVQEGDIIEGSALVHITAAHSASGIATFYLIIIDAGAVDITTCSISLSDATGIDQTITVPFSYTATSGTSGTIEFRPEAASSDGATAVTVSKPNSNNKWLYAKHTRP